MAHFDYNNVGPLLEELHVTQRETPTLKSAIQDTIPFVDQWAILLLTCFANLPGLVLCPAAFPASSPCLNSLKTDLSFTAQI